MTEDLTTLVALARKVEMSPAQQEQQRRSFAYGNTRLQNPRITRELIDEQAEALTRGKG